MYRIGIYNVSIRYAMRLVEADSSAFHSPSPQGMYSSMNTILLCACVLWICVVICDGYGKIEPYGQCVKSCAPHHPVWIKKMYRYCVKNGDCVYCKYFGCPEVKECKRRMQLIPPVPTVDRNCMVCPGTCVYAGKAYKRRDRFKSVDEINECECDRNGRVHCVTKIDPEPRKFCGV